MVDANLMAARRFGYDKLAVGRAGMIPHSKDTDFDVQHHRTDNQQAGGIWPGSEMTIYPFGGFIK